MLNRNEYFEEMKRITEEYTKNKRAHEEKKKEIINTFGWDSNELKNWYEEHDKMKYPIESGAAKAYRAFQYSLVNGNEEFEMEDFLWDKEVEDFVDTLRKAGISTFIYTNQSTAVMENLHGFEEAGCKMEGLCKIERTVERFGTENTEEILGIRFIVPVIEENNNTFEEGKEYTFTEVADDGTWRTVICKVTRRTAEFVTLENAETGAVVRKKIKSKDGVEYVIPLGIDGNSASALWANVPTESEPEVEFVN